MDLTQLMQIANQVKEQIGQSQAEAARLRIVGEAGGGMARVVMNGKHEVLEVTLDPKVISGGDKGLLEDLIRAACNQASARVAEELRQRMGGLAQGLGIDLSALGFPDGKP